MQDVLNRNPGYWDQPRPYLNQIILKTIPESNAGQASIVQGGLDFMFGYLYQYGSNATAPGVTTFKVPIQGFNMAYLNTSGGITGLFKDVRARQALMYGVSLTDWVQALSQDTTMQGPTSLYPSTSPYYDPSLTYPAQDTAKAQSLINQVIASGTPFDFTIVAPNNSDTGRAAQYLQQAMNAFTGVKASVQLVPQQNWQSLCLNQGKFDVCLQPGAVIFNGPEPNTFNLLDSAGSFNVSHYSSPAMDADLAATLSATTQGARVAAYDAVQKQYLADVPFITYGAQTRYMLIRNTVGGIVNVGQGLVLPQYLYRCASACATN